MTADAVLLATDLAALRARHPAAPEGGAVSPHRTYDGEALRVRDIVFEPGTVLPEHDAPDPIVVVALAGEVDFRVRETTFHLAQGGVLQVAAGEPHQVSSASGAHLLVVLVGRAAG